MLGSDAGKDDMVFHENTPVASPVRTPVGTPPQGSPGTPNKTKARALKWVIDLGSANVEPLHQRELIGTLFIAPCFAQELEVHTFLSAE